MNQEEYKYYTLDTMLTHLWLKPIESMVQNWEAKAIAALAGTLFVQLVDLIVQITEVRPIFIFGLICLVGIDFVSALWFAIRRGERIVLSKIRITFYKIIEYALVVSVFVIFHNMTKNTEIELLGQIAVHGAIMFLAATEVISVVKHWQGDEQKTRKFFRTILSVGKDARGRRVIEERVEEVQSYDDEGKKNK